MELYGWQQEAISALTEGDGQVLVVAPTGGGKSMCYQHPATELPGTALIITPLVALMADQVASLEARGVAATYLASTLDPLQMRQRIDGALAGSYKLLYVAPERLASQRFVDDVLARLDLSLIAIDEAHCISQWGHDFRPDYLQIGTLVERLQPPRVIACTATATPEVRREIIERLHMDRAHQVLRGFARENLELSVEDVSGNKSKEQRICEEVKRALGKARSGAGSAIVYTGQRRHAEEVADALRRAGWRAEHYHAGMDGDARTAVQTRFQAGDLDVVTATNAFGMGIDRADIRLVLHYAIPESLEAYYQEVGRAGRDGRPARGVLFVSDPDIAWRFKLIAGEAGLDAERALRRRELLRSMVAYCETTQCRHDGILRYFEDEAEALGGCGHCDNCRAARDGTLGRELDEQASSEIVRGSLRAIRQLPFPLGAGAIASYLVGNPSKTLQKHELQKLQGFASLRQYAEGTVKRLLRRYVATGLLAIDTEHSTLRITRRAVDIIESRRDNCVRVPPARLRRGVAGAVDANDKVPAPEEADMDGDAWTLFSELKTWRDRKADAQQVPHYAILQDATLRAIAVRRPSNDDAMLAIPGIGPTKLERYGPALLAMVRQSETAAVATA